MSEWYERAYKGGPMVDLPGFPRPMYPPSAAPAYQPSIDGPDVIAYKRTVSRAGRWPWGAFDDSYSNAFAFGQPGGNVGESGIAGVQRQQDIQATGNIGKETFNTLRSIRVPEGLPNGGEMAMDATAQRLLAEAWEIFHGKPTPPPHGSKAEARLAEARKWIGYTESPPGSNRNQFGEWYGMDGQPWCAMFTTWSDQKGARPSSSFARGSRYAYVPYILADARSGAHGLSLTGSPRPGDLVIYDWDGDETYDHIGLFEGWVEGKKGTFTALEGNTSIDSNSNGGEVMRRTRDTSCALFVRVAE